MTEPTCDLCHKRPAREGFVLCDTCKGFDLIAERAESSTGTPQAKPGPSNSPPLNPCEKCGEPIEPYQVGRNTIIEGQCLICFMRAKYGEDWKPGNKKEKKSAYMKKYHEDRKEKKLGQAAPDLLPEIAESYHAESGQTILLLFQNEDSAIYERLMSGAKRERRTPDQHVLYLLERVVEV